MSNTPINVEQRNKVEQKQVRPITHIPEALRSTISPETWNTLTYEQQGLLQQLDKLPPKLQGVVPESVWDTLSDSQRIEFMISHGMIPRFEISGISADAEAHREAFEQFKKEVEPEGFPPTEEETQETPVVPAIEGDVATTERDGLREGFEKVKEQIQQIQDAEKEDSLPADMENPPAESPDLPTNIDNSGAKFSHREPVFAGFRPNPQILENPEEYTHGPVDKASTWIANFVEKFIGALSSQQ